MKTQFNTTDYLRRFLFRAANVRAERVRLENTVAEALSRRTYPAAVAEQLGMALAAAGLLAATVKFEGRLTLQVRGSGVISLLLAQALPDGGLRGLARLAHQDSEIPDNAGVAELFGQAELVIAIAAERDGVPYQGIVPVLPAGLGATIEHYFAQSEQIPTRILLAAGEGLAHGLLLQALPNSADGPPVSDEPSDWRLMSAALDARAQVDLQHLGDEMLMKRLFPTHDLELFAPSPLKFQCQCSRERTSRMVQALGEQEAREIVEAEGQVEVACEFCGASYEFDRLDVAQLFSGGVFNPHNGRA